jgi:hypothetical protein
MLFHWTKSMMFNSYAIFFESIISYWDSMNDISLETIFLKLIRLTKKSFIRVDSHVIVDKDKIF